MLEGQVIECQLEPWPPGVVAGVDGVPGDRERQRVGGVGTRLIAEHVTRKLVEQQDQSEAGARIVDIPFAELESLPSINAKGGIVTAEAYAVHRKLLEEAGARYDPRVSVRLKRGATQDAADYIDLMAARRALIARAAEISAPFDALVMPTVPVVAPALAPLEADDDLYAKTNVLVLRNPTVGNFLDRCALSIPCHAPGDAPVGLMLMGEHGGDRRLLSVGLAVEAALGNARRTS